MHVGACIQTKAVYNTHALRCRDEEVIAEHDKERGTRQKIDEPDTPYVYDSTVDGEYSQYWLLFTGSANGVGRHFHLQYSHEK